MQSGNKSNMLILRVNLHGSDCSITTEHHYCYMFQRDNIHVLLLKLLTELSHCIWIIEFSCLRRSLHCSVFKTLHCSQQKVEVALSVPEVTCGRGGGVRLSSDAFPVPTAPSSEWRAMDSSGEWCRRAGRDQPWWQDWEWEEATMGKGEGSSRRKQHEGIAGRTWGIFRTGGCRDCATKPLLRHDNIWCIIILKKKIYVY